MTRREFFRKTAVGGAAVAIGILPSPMTPESWGMRVITMWTKYGRLQRIYDPVLGLNELYNRRMDQMVMRRHP